ncbi:MAG: L-serine ammonia-lyase, iron-sulfur-dependent, subunit alpha [Clostridia bacterium]
MLKTDEKYSAYLNVLRNHLRPAMGCTEPIAIAYAAATAVNALGKIPERAEVLASGNIIKNARSVTVPNTGGKKGIEAACAAGMIAGDASKELQVISCVSKEQQAEIEIFLQKNVITVDVKPDARLFDIVVTVYNGQDVASARIADRHTNVVTVSKNGEALTTGALGDENQASDPNEALLRIEDIFDFANSCELSQISDLLDKQIELNRRIAHEGMEHSWGACVGRVLLESNDATDVRVRAKAYAAAGSDARMSGCELPVMINSGSGNQGITVSVPLIEYAEGMQLPKEQLHRALLLSNLTAIRLKALIGCLSAYCGAISAGCASAAGIAYLLGGDLHLISHTLVNSLAILSGTICDGAKPSCAAKIACAIDAGIMGYQMALQDKEFRGGEGIVKKGVENTIISIGRLGKDGMRETDREILKIMVG